MVKPLCLKLFREQGKGLRVQDSAAQRWSPTALSLEGSVILRFKYYPVWSTGLTCCHCKGEKAAALMYHCTGFMSSSDVWHVSFA